MANHYNVHAWEIPRTEELGGLKFMGGLKTKVVQLLGLPRLKIGKMECFNLDFIFLI